MEVGGEGGRPSSGHRLALLHQLIFQHCRGTLGMRCDGTYTLALFNIENLKLTKEYSRFFLKGARCLAPFRFDRDVVGKHSWSGTKDRWRQVQ